MMGRRLSAAGGSGFGGESAEKLWELLPDSVTQRYSRCLASLSYLHACMRTSIHPYIHPYTHAHMRDCAGGAPRQAKGKRNRASRCETHTHTHTRTRARARTHTRMYV